MTDTERRTAAAKFTADWKGRGMVSQSGGTYAKYIHTRGICFYKQHYPRGTSYSTLGYT